MSNSKKIQCPRCGGSGETEFSHVVYGICFMCKGSGMVYPQRVKELTDKAKSRKANKEAKHQARLKEEGEVEKARWEAYYKWQYAKNLDYFKVRTSQKKNPSELLFLDTFAAMSKNILKENSTKEEIIEMIKDFFSEESYTFKYALSEYTINNFGFCFMEIPREYDLDFGASIMHEYEYDLKIENA